MKTLRLTTAQALVRFLAAQITPDGERFVAGVWAIFGHGNVAALGEALYAEHERLPTYRGHNEQTMAHAAIAYAKALNRRRVMAVTTSIGPGATNLITAAATAHANRLPVLLLPGDVFANRRPDPVLQQIEDFADGTISVNDTFKPVSRYFDRITRPEQLLRALPRAIATLSDPAACGPVTLSLCQDVQAEGFDWPLDFFHERTVAPRRPAPDQRELQNAAQVLAQSHRPLVIAGGGVHYANASDTLRTFTEAHNLPVAETQAGKSALPFEHPNNVGAIGVTGTSAANTLAADADVILAVGTRLQDFTTGSWTLFRHPDVNIINLNVAAPDTVRPLSSALVADAGEGLKALSKTLGNWRLADRWTSLRQQWHATIDAVTAAPQAGSEHNARPSDAQVIGAVQRASDDHTVLVCAAGGLPGELHKLWKAPRTNAYHLEYGYSCMGYEIAGGLGVKLARPDREVVVMVGDGSYLMANSELATSVMMGLKIIVVVLDNRGFGCINRLQIATGGASFNNLLEDAHHTQPANIDFAAHARALGATAEQVTSVRGLAAAMVRARAATQSYCIVIDTDPLGSTEAGGHWWDVAVPEVSERATVNTARAAYEAALAGDN